MEQCGRFSGMSDEELAERGGDAIDEIEAADREAAEAARSGDYRASRRAVDYSRDIRREHADLIREINWRAARGPGRSTDRPAR
jgi:hypothetical protein